MARKFLTPVDMGSNKIVHLANGSASDDAAAFGQIPSIYQTGMLYPTMLRTPPTGTLGCDGSAVSRATYATLFAAIIPLLGTCTISLATPGVVTLAGHGFVSGDKMFLTTTGALPTGLSANTLYFVIRNDINSFWLATSLGNAVAGTKIATSGSQSGVHSVYACSTQIGDGSTTFNLPDLRGDAPVGADTMFPSTAQGAAAGAAGRLPFASTLGTFGVQFGEQTHTLTAAELPVSAYSDSGHNHTQNAHQHDDRFPTGTGGSPYGGMTSAVTSYADATHLQGSNVTSSLVTPTNISASASISNSGGGGAHNNVQPSRACYWVIGV